MSSWLDIGGHIAYIWVGLGMLMIALKRPVLGFAFRLVGELGWLTLGVLMGMTSIWFWEIIFIIVDVVGMYVWARNCKEKSVEMSSE